MKKNFSWMRTAIRPMVLTMLFFGAMTTSCSSDDDDDKNTPTPDTPKQETKFDIELNFVAHPKSLQYFEYDFKYVDANGNTKTIDIDQDTQGSSLGTLADVPIYKSTVGTMASIEAYADLNEPFIYRVTLKDQPVGKTISYTTISHVKENVTISETLQYATPAVLAMKPADGSVCVPFSIKTWKVTPEKWADYLKTVEGKTIQEASNEFVIK